MIMNISALSMEEAELMLKVLDNWIIHHYNVYGVRRLTSFNRRANDGIRAQIRVEIRKDIWDYVRDGVMWEVTHKLEKGIAYSIETIAPDFKVIEFCTCEAEI